MWGLLIAIAIAVCSAVFGGSSWPMAYIAATKFLFVWYLVFCIVALIFQVMSILGLVGGGTLMSLLTGSKFLAKATVATSALGVLALLFGTLGSAIQIIGAFLLKTAGQPGMAFAQFNRTYLIVGSILVFISIFWKSAGSKRSS